MPGMMIRDEPSINRSSPEKLEKPDKLRNESLDNDDSDEDHDRLSNIHNMRRNNSSSLSSLRRYDEHSNFILRSERAINMPDEKPTAAEKRRRKVQFPDHDDKLVTAVHVEEEPMTSGEMYRLYMTQEDFSRCDRDMEMTSWRWKNHLDGKIALDETENTLRGLEEHLDTERDGRAIRSAHQRNVLQEMNRQKHSGAKQLDWNKIREASERISYAGMERARRLALEDAEDVPVIWGNKKAPEISRLSKSFGSHAPKNAKKKNSANKKAPEKESKKKSIGGGLFGLFGKKK